LKRSKKLQNPDFQTKSGFSLFVGSAKNSGYRHLSGGAIGGDENHPIYLHRIRAFLTELQYFA